MGEAPPSPPPPLDETLVADTVSLHACMSSRIRNLHAVCILQRLLKLWLYSSEILLCCLLTKINLLVTLTSLYTLATIVLIMVVHQIIIINNIIHTGTIDVMAAIATEPNFRADWPE